ncbi:MAG: type II toxin-antitoxin system VapC family toxin [Gemmataceae bacterium]
MTFLVDANILSEPTRRSPNPKVVAWLRAQESELVVDAVFGEILAGILALPPGRKRNQLQSWFDATIATMKCPPWDATVARRWARLVLDLKAKGKTLPVIDSMIAATALAHRLTLATHNVRDFQNARVAIIDPFADVH